MKKSEKLKDGGRKVWGNVIARNLILAALAVGVFVGISALILNILTRHNQQKPVPDFVGVSLAEVRQQALAAKLELEIVDSIWAPIYPGGTVIEQLPTAGTEVKNGRRVFVTITSHQQKMVPVPYVTGFSLRQAKNMIEMTGLEIKELRYVLNPATNYILAELAGRDTIRRTSNRHLEVGTGLTLIVGRAGNASWVGVPDVVGLPLNQAQSRLWERGLNVGTITRDEGINLVNQRDARVYRQSPPSGRQVELGTSVSIALTLDETKLPR